MIYTGLNGLLYITKLVSGGRIQPPDADLQEYWTWKPKGGHAPWFVRAATNGGKFWGEQDEPKQDTQSEGSLVEVERNGSFKMDNFRVEEVPRPVGHAH
jgi:poly(3-hydroxyalkanoate) synthetase